jgi:glycosyltransferase involved in cell wall biosynthesis
MVSVVIICYNYGHYLAEAIDSIINQTYPFWECIIINDGSTDDTEIIAQQKASVDPRISYYYQSNKGPSSARNFALSKVKGKYVQFLDADDYIHSNKLFHQVNYLESNPNVDIVYGNVFVFKDLMNGDRSLSNYKYTTQQVSGRENILSELVHDSVFLINTPLVRYSAFDKVGFFDVEISRHEDWLLWNKMAIMGSDFHYVDDEKTSVYVRAHSGSLTENRERMWFNKMEARKKILAIVNNQIAVNSNNSLLKKYKSQSSYLLNIERYRYEFHFGNIFYGTYFMILSIIKSYKIYYHMYDGLYWLKERLKKK